ncbi:hypothetical protein BKA62DRAFT_700039 [Auriculariales sp. MPI-PUGE-AT-0066]|nr:hypothetical protein BKA62DRAFT_700039 [Auriculariales sp. MPI-PUGE-AT-0066]
MASARHFIDRALPLVIFPALGAVAFSIVMGHLNGLALQINASGAQCPAQGLGTTAIRRTYTGLDVIDKALCTVVAVFTENLGPNVLEFTHYWLSTGAVTFIFPAVEASRRGTSLPNIILALPVLVLLVAQVATIAVVLPFYWTVFLVSGQQRGSKDSFITESHAESMIVATLLGLVPSTILMLSVKSPLTIAIWQLCPLYFFLVQHWYLRVVRPPGSKSPSGFDILQAFYACLFVLAARVHFKVITKYLANPAAALAFFKPPVQPNLTASMSTQTLNFLQWDSIFAQASCILASFWFADSPKTLLIMVGWYIIAVPLVGPFAGFIAVLVWRELKLNGHTSAPSTLRPMTTVLPKKKID